MDRRVTVRAAPVEIANGIKQSWSSRVSTSDVTGIAYARHAHLEQLRVAGAMRFMAVSTVLHNRGVFKQEGTSAFRVATEAILVHGALLQLTRIGRAVGIVATGAGNFALAIWHVRGALQLRAPHLVTPQAKFGLHLLQASVLRQWRIEASFVGQQGAHFLVHLVAIHTSHATRLMRATCPEQLHAAGMALHASTILFGSRVLGILRETDWHCVLAATRLDVSPPGSMTGFASTRLIW